MYTVGVKFYCGVLSGKELLTFTIAQMTNVITVINISMQVICTFEQYKRIIREMSQPAASQPKKRTTFPIPYCKHIVLESVGHSIDMSKKQHEKLN